MKTLSIDIPDGFEVDTFDKASNKITLKEKPKDVLQRINTDEDVLTDNGYTWATFNSLCEGLDEDERAFRFLKLLMRSLNGADWIPDFDNSNQVKYEPRFMGGSSGFRFGGYDAWDSYSHVGSRLCFKESRLAVHAGSKFTKWYKLVIVIK